MVVILYSSGFHRRPQKLDEIFQLIWRLLSKFQINLLFLVFLENLAFQEIGTPNY